MLDKLYWMRSLYSLFTLSAHVNRIRCHPWSIASFCVKSITLLSDHPKKRGFKSWVVLVEAISTWPLAASDELDTSHVTLIATYWRSSLLKCNGRLHFRVGLQRAHHHVRWSPFDHTCPISLIEGDSTDATDVWLALATFWLSLIQFLLLVVNMMAIYSKGFWCMHSELRLCALKGWSHLFQCFRSSFLFCHPLTFSACLIFLHVCLWICLSLLYVCLLGHLACF